MIVWGGQIPDVGAIDTGGIYDVATDSWLPMNNVDAPSARVYHSAIWSGHDALIWGGHGNNGDTFGDGKRYEPSADTWTNISNVNSPSPRRKHTAVRAGGQMIIWGGEKTGYLNDGGIYFIKDDYWNTLTASGAPSARSGHTSVWTGTQMIVWGGLPFDGGGGLYCLSVPTAFDDVYSAAENSTLNIPAPGVLANDVDPQEDVLTAELVSGPAHGVLTLNSDGSFVYTPDEDFLGADSFVYRCKDATYTSNDATVNIYVGNQAPLANPDSANTSENTPVTIDVLLNDSDPDGDPIHVVDVTTPQNGTAVINADDTITYTPNATFSGTDSFDYTIDDGKGGTDSATVTITVEANCMFCDDFEDGILSPDWTYQGSWSESNGSVIGDSLNTQKALAIAPSSFGGCSTCTIEASLESGGGARNKVWLLGWYVDKANRVELLMKEDQDKWILKQRFGGVVVAKSKAKVAIDPNVPYDIKLRFDGISLILDVNGVQVINMNAVGSPSGTIAFQAKKTVGRFDYINVY
jgi:VCBS repeat-containing protein